MSTSDNKTTDFGFQQIPIKEKARRVADVFDSVASRYDLMNDLMSFGIHRLWKKFAIQLCSVRKGHEVLDIAGGTGDLAIQFSKIVKSEGHVVLADINNAMLQMGRDKCIDKGAYSNISFVQANAECLPFENNSFNCITIAFGLRNVTHKDQALRSMFRVLKPGGKLVILEFSKPQSKIVNRLYDTYSFKILPKLGQLVASDADSYKYLAESIRMHPNQQMLKTKMEEAGFSEVAYYNLSNGIVAVHKGVKL